MTPPSVGRRVSVVDFSIRQVIMATDGVYRKALNERAKERPQYIAPVVPINNSVRIEAAQTAATEPNQTQPNNVIQFPIPSQNQAVESQPANSGEVVDMERYRMADEARRLADEARGDNHVAA